MLGLQAMQSVFFAAGTGAAGRIDERNGGWAGMGVCESGAGDFRGTAPGGDGG